MIASILQAIGAVVVVAFAMITALLLMAKACDWASERATEATIRLASQLLQGAPKHWSDEMKREAAQMLLDGRSVDHVVQVLGGNCEDLRKDADLISDLAARKGWQ